MIIMGAINLKKPRVKIEINFSMVRNGEILFSGEGIVLPQYRVLPYVRNLVEHKKILAHTMVLGMNKEKVNIFDYHTDAIDANKPVFMEFVKLGAVSGKKIIYQGVVASRQKSILFNQGEIKLNIQFKEV